MQFDIIETVFQVRPKGNGETLSPQELNDMDQEPYGNASDNSLEMPVSPSKTSALPQISGDSDKIPNESEMPITPSKTTASSPQTSGDNLVDAKSMLQKGGKSKMLMYIDRDFDTNVSLSEDGSKLETKVCKEIVSCYKVIDEVEGTKEERPTILIDRRQTEKTVTFKDNSQETLVLRKEIITYPAHHSSGRDVPTKEHTDPFSPIKSPRQVSDGSKSETVTVTADESFVQFSDPKDSFKKTRQGADVAKKAHSEIVTIETFDVLVELGEHLNLSANLAQRGTGNSRGEMPELKNGLPNSVAKPLEERAKITRSFPNQNAKPEADKYKKLQPDMQEFVTIETTEVVVEVLEYKPSSQTPNWFGKQEPKKSENPSEKMPKISSESSPLKRPDLSGKLGPKTYEKPDQEMPDLKSTMETLTVDISEYVIQKIQQ
jgi:hypothetical protein